MQKDISTVHGGNNFISPNGLDYTSLYSSFSPYPSSSNSPSSSTTGDLTTATITPVSSKTNTRDQEFALSPSPHSILVQEQQDLVNSHNLCLAHLREAAEEAEALRLENTTLRVANRDLNKRLSLVIQTSLQKRLMPSDYILQPPIITGFRDLCIDDKRSNTESGVWPGDHQQGFVQSPTSVMDHQSDLIVKRNGGVERVSLPKSISVRSNGYLKTSQGVGDGNHGSRTRSLNRSRTASPPKATQRVYVRGGRKEGEAVELETFNQGMCKTELCNKWQETGACPYGDHCQFAHGIEELRPVIRHPRYKTEVCRMVLAGDPCPYGHRCHFRHALTDQEKLIAAYNPRVLTLNR